MKNENAKFVFINSLLGNVESYTDVTHKIPSRIYFNYPLPNFDITDQKAVLAELKKKKIIAGFKFDDGDFIVTRPSRSGIIDFLHRLERPVIPPEAIEPIDTALEFDEKTGVISMGGKSCDIPINTNQYFLCKTIFAVPFGTLVKEIDFLDLMEWIGDGKDSVYDAMRAINKRTKEDLGIEKLMKWKVRRIYIDYKTE